MRLISAIRVISLALFCYSRSRSLRALACAFALGLRFLAVLLCVLLMFSLLLYVLTVCDSVLFMCLLALFLVSVPQAV